MIRSIPLFLAFTSLIASAQQDPRRLVQFSGVVITGDSLLPVPFTNVLIKGSYRGTMSDVFGYYSFVAQEGDTILFSAVGFQRSQYVLPAAMPENKYSMIHVLDPDTILLPTITIYPWPSKEQFAEAFMALDLPDDDYQLALKNLSPAYESFRYQMSMDNTRLYSQGAVTNNLFNPIAWAQFIQAWRSGAFKKKP